MNSLLSFTVASTALPSIVNATTISSAPEKLPVITGFPWSKISPAVGERIATVGTGKLTENTTVALAVLPFASVATATTEYSPSPMETGGVKVNSLPSTTTGIA